MYSRDGKEKSGLEQHHTIAALAIHMQLTQEQVVKKALVSLQCVFATLRRLAATGTVEDTPQ